MSKDIDNMTLRDYFAAQAMTANIQYANKADQSDQSIAEWCYAIADAMLAERSKPKEEDDIKGLETIYKKELYNYEMETIN